MPSTKFVAVQVGPGRYNVAEIVRSTGEFLGYMFEDDCDCMGSAQDHAAEMNETEGAE